MDSLISPMKCQKHFHNHRNAIRRTSASKFARTGSAAINDTLVIATGSITELAAARGTAIYIYAKVLAGLADRVYLDCAWRGDEQTC